MMLKILKQVKSRVNKAPCYGDILLLNYKGIKNLLFHIFNKSIIFPGALKITD